MSDLCYLRKPGMVFPQDHEDDLIFHFFNVFTIRNETGSNSR